MENHVLQNPLRGLDHCSSDPMYGQCLTNKSQTSLESTIAVLSTKLTIPKDAQIEWEEFQSRTEELVPNSYNSRLCNTPLEIKKVDLQLSPSPPPAVPVPEIPDTGPDPQPSQGDAVMVGFMGNHNYHEVALRAASEQLPPDEGEVAQVNGEECCKATANIDKTQVRNAASEFRVRSHDLEELLRPASKVVVKSSFETPQEPLILSTDQVHNNQGLVLSSTEQELMAVYQRAIEGIADGKGRHVTILTTLPEMDQWAISSVERVNVAQKFIGTTIKEGKITLRKRHEEMETHGEEILEESWENIWNLIDIEVKEGVEE